MDEKKAEMVTYQELIKEMQIISGFSYFKTRTILKELSKLLQNHVGKGLSIDCQGLCTMFYTSKDYIIFDDNLYDLEKQATDLHNILNIDIFTMKSFLTNYYQLIKNKVEQGFQVNLKGIFYLTPTINKDIISIKSRISPQLKKPALAVYVVSPKVQKTIVEGIYFETLNRNQVRLNMILDSSLKVPNRVIYDVSNEKQYLS